MSVSRLGALKVSDPKAWREAVRSAMAEHEGKIPEAAESVGVSVPTFYRWLKTLPSVKRAPRGPRLKSGAPGPLVAAERRWTDCSCHAGVKVVTRRSHDGERFRVRRCLACTRFEDDESAKGLVAALLELLEAYGSERNLPTVADALEGFERMVEQP